MKHREHLSVMDDSSVPKTPILAHFSNLKIFFTCYLGQPLPHVQKLFHIVMWMFMQYPFVVQTYFSYMEVGISVRCMIIDVCKTQPYYLCEM